jgi:hypothetical protein
LIENENSQRKSAQQLLRYKFLDVIADSGLKTHQSPCDWASGSLNAVNSALNCYFQRRNDKEKRENGKLQTKSDENKKKKFN